MATYVELDEEEDDDYTDYITSPPVGRCACCEDGLHLTEELFLVTFAQPYLTAQGVVLATHGQDGQPLWEPLFYCFSCWENVKEEAQEACDNVPPVESVEGLLCCDICSSDICAGETMMTETFGEIHWSERTPNGVATPVFVPMSEASHICLACVASMDTEHIRPGLLEDLAPAAGLTVASCTTGIHGRCWRSENFNKLNANCTTCPHKR